MITVGANVFSDQSWFKVYAQAHAKKVRISGSGPIPLSPESNTTEVIVS